VVTASVNGAGTSASFALTNNAGAAFMALPASGTPQTAQIMTPFDQPLGVKIVDAYGNPVEGVDVTFTAPASGPSATFGGASTITVSTGPDGIATAIATANGTPGPYQITASGTGVGTEAVFNLVNSSGPVLHASSTSGDGQATQVNGAFQCLLQIKVTSDGTTAAPGVSIDFVAPASGPSAMLSDGVNHSTTITRTTDANGLASVTATANDIAGTYVISAGQTGSGSSLATYQLTNLAADDHLFANGFDSTPALCGQ
ncbi:MAG TPA: hypothetical protein VF132_00035, partial [Rudaea sp.]